MCVTIQLSQGGVRKCNNTCGFVDSESIFGKLQTVSLSFVNTKFLQVLTTYIFESYLQSVQ